MAKKLEIYKCMVCGNIVEVLHGGDGELVCCGQPMANLAAKTADQGKEKHVPQKGAAVRVVTRSGELLDVTFDLDVVDDKNVITNVWLKGGGKFICKGEYYFHP